MVFIARFGALLYFSGVRPTKITLSQLESFLLSTCNVLRGSMNASDYKEYVFGMLFLKRYDIDYDLAELQPLLPDTQQSLETFNADHRQQASNVFADGPASYIDKKTPTAYLKTRQKIATVVERLETNFQTLHTELTRINGMITTDEARELILLKHNELVTTELNRYLLAERRKLLATLENLWDKYTVSTAHLETRRA